jgi:hypothetical protein
MEEKTMNKIMKRLMFTGLASMVIVAGSFTTVAYSAGTGGLALPQALHLDAGGEFVGSYSQIWCMSRH